MIQKRMKSPCLALLASLALGSASSSYGALVVTVAESPSLQQSSLLNTQVFDFNNLGTGLQSNVNWSGVGTFNQLYIKNADQYGGATDSTHPNGTRYSVQGVGTSVSSTTLSLNSDSGYFGMWWSAGDASNLLQFYKDGNLVARFTTASLLQDLGSSYYGNPRNRSLDSSEPFAFINFFADANTNWDTIVFSNSSSSGFESDNYTSRITTYNPLTDGPDLPGKAVARVDGTTVTKVSPTAKGAELWGSQSAIPGAPAPPMMLMVAFGAVVLMKSRKLAGGKGKETTEPAFAA